jgi:hypothetical protein
VDPVIFLGERVGKPQAEKTRNVTGPGDCSAEGGQPPLPEAARSSPSRFFSSCKN